MTEQEHLEISRKLALAIGWKSEHVHTHLHGTDYAISIIKPDDETALRIFDYRDEVIAFRVAERFDCFPYRNFHGKWTTHLTSPYAGAADTPQLAIALAVIEGTAT